MTKRTVRFNVPSDSVEWDQIEEQEKKLYKEDQAKRLSERESEQEEEEEKNSDNSTINTQNEDDDISEHYSRPVTRQRSHSVATTSHKTLLEEDNNKNSFSPLRSILKNASIFNWNSQDKEKEQQNGPASFDGPRTRSYSTSSTTSYTSSASSTTTPTWRQKIQQFQQKFEKVWTFLTFQSVFEVRGPSNEPRPRKYKYQRQSV